MDQGHYDVSLNPGLEEDDPGEMRECAACERLHSRATMELTFKGRPYWPNYKYGTKCVLPRPHVQLYPAQKWLWWKLQQSCDMMTMAEWLYNTTAG